MLVENLSKTATGGQISPQNTKSRLDLTAKHKGRSDLTVKQRGSRRKTTNRSETKAKHQGQSNLDNKQQRVGRISPQNMGTTPPEQQT